MDFVFFHTARSNEDLFAHELSQNGMSVSGHVVREDLLLRAGQVGLGDKALWQEVETAMRGAIQGYERLICTCSTLGPIADHLRHGGLACDRSDAFLARAFLSHAIHNDSQARCAVVIVAPSTRAATQSLFDDMQAELRATGLQVDVLLIDGLWDLFLKGDHEGYLVRLAEALDVLVAGNQYYHHFALAQASMARCLPYCLPNVAERLWTVPQASCAYLSSL